MGFNKIMNTILKFRRLAAQNDIDQQIHKGYQKYKKLLQSRENFENLSDEENKFIEDFEKLLDQAAAAEDTTEYDLKGISNIPFTEQDRVIHRTNQPMDDVINETIENPLFPYITRSRVERNTLNDSNVKSEIEKVQKYLRDNKELFKNYQAYLEKIDSIIRYNDNLHRSIDKNNSIIEQSNKQITDSNDEILQLQKTYDQENKILDNPQYDESEEEYTYRSYYDQIIKDNAALIDLYSVGMNEDKYNEAQKAIDQAIKDIENELSSLEEESKNQTGDYSRLKEHLNKLSKIDKPIAQAKYLIAAAITEDDEEYRSQDESGYEIYDYKKAVEYNNELKKLTNDKINLLPNMDENNSRNWNWKDIKEQISEVYKIKEHMDILQRSKQQIEKLEVNRQQLREKIKEAENNNNNYNKQLKENEDKYRKAEDSTRTDKYKERQALVTQYIEQQEYFGTLQRAYNMLAKGSQDNKRIPDEKARIEQLNDSIAATQDFITSMQDKYDKAMRTNSGSRSAQEAILIQSYDKAQKTLDNERIKLRNLQRTISEKLDAVNIAKIDYKKIADKIIQRLESKQSLLGILLTQSINKFVSYYLANNNYQAPNLSSKMKLLHYYIADGAPDTNIRLRDLQDFQDSDKNLELLQNIALVLMKESKDNIMSIFISILKNDFNEIYKSYGLSSVDNTKLFIVDQDTNERMGPYTGTQIKQKLILDKNPNVNDVISRIIQGKRHNFKIIEDKLTGDQIYDLLKSDDQQEIKKLFDKVKIVIQEYIRNELQIKSFEICNNPGNNFYSVMLAQAVQDDIASHINYDTLDNFLASTKSKANKELNKTRINQNIESIMNAIIEQLCANFNTNNEYHMFIQFLQLYNVQNDDMNQKDNEPYKGLIN